MSTSVRTFIAIAFPILLVSLLVAQTWDTSAQAAKEPPRIRISFPSGLSLDSVWLEYGLFGPSGGRVHSGLPGTAYWNRAIETFDPVGGQGHVVSPGGGPDHYYEVVALENGNPVDRFKAAVWTKGCRIAAFDVVVGTKDIELPFTCSPLKSVELIGHVQGVEFGGKPARLTVGYIFGVSPLLLTDCRGKGLCTLAGAVPQIPEVATGQVAADGSYKVELPDFAEDPLVSGASMAGFAPYLIDLHKVLEPQMDLLSGFYFLKVAASYPGDQILVPSK